MASGHFSQTEVTVTQAIEFSWGGLKSSVKYPSEKFKQSVWILIPMQCPVKLQEPSEFLNLEWENAFTKWNSFLYTSTRHQKKKLTVSPYLIFHCRKKFGNHSFISIITFQYHDNAKVGKLHMWIPGHIHQHSPTIWPLTVSLSLGLSLFKSSLWSVERERQRERITKQGKIYSLFYI